MRGFQSEVNLGKARSGGSATDASAFWDLLDPPMRARVVAAGFGDYAAGLRRTQPRFPPTMRYALMERWSDCTDLEVSGDLPAVRDLENERLRRHQSRQSSAVSRLQAEVERLRTKLEVEGIPLDSSEEDEDGSSSDDAPPSPHPPAAAGPSRRRR
ncbi:hypothetical protein JCGZ_13811 [Jatropha curcas]|uniref:Uncharacterized protein n=1 Tax=Jatropha curcas TaxID=180498 RepID=A0A067KK95_JATCU|nr:hypothetical protein JCGZ_13811 [Jatropha curcas]